MKRIALLFVGLSVGLLSTTVGAGKDPGIDRLETLLAAPVLQLHTTAATPSPPAVTFEMPKWVPHFGLDLDADAPRDGRFVATSLVESRDGLERETSLLAEFSDPLHTSATIDSAILSPPTPMDVFPPDSRILQTGSATFGTIRVSPVGQFSNR